MRGSKEEEGGGRREPGRDWKLWVLEVIGMRDKEVLSSFRLHVELDVPIHCVVPVQPPRYSLRTCIA